MPSVFSPRAMARSTSAAAAHPRARVALLVWLGTRAIVRDLAFVLSARTADLTTSTCRPVRFTKTVSGRVVADRVGWTVFAGVVVRASVEAFKAARRTAITTTRGVVSVARARISGAGVHTGVAYAALGPRACIPIVAPPAAAFSAGREAIRIGLIAAAVGLAPILAAETIALGAVSNATTAVAAGIVVTGVDPIVIDTAPVVAGEGLASALAATVHRIAARSR